MALKGVSASPAAAASAGASAGKSGAAGGSAAGALMGAGASGAASGGTDSTSQSSGSGPVNFLRMLAQQAGGGDSKGEPAKLADSKPSDKTSDDSASSVAPDPSAAALALLMQSMAAALAPTQASQAKTAPAPSQEAQTSNDATAAIGATDPKGAKAIDGDAMASMLSMLAKDADADDADTDAQVALKPAADALLRTDDSDSSSTLTASTASSATTDAANSSASAAAAQMGVGSHFTLQHSPGSPAVEVKSAVGSTAWADELGGKVTWMAHQGIESASLSLSPEHLGPVEVRISVQDGGTSVWFGAAQADTRSALENALPRLRDMFASQGMTLADAGVSREAPKQQPKQAPPSAVSAISGLSDDEHSVAALLKIRLGLLDTYA